MRRVIGIAFISSMIISNAGGAMRAQEPGVPRIGVIIPSGPGVAYEIIQKGFADLGYVEGKSIILEPRFMYGQTERAKAFSQELVALKVDAIVGPGLVGVGAAREYTKTIPIVFSAAPDPVSLGYVASLERPGANITGITSFDPNQASEQIGILKRLLPNLSRIAVISDVDIPRIEGFNPLENPLADAAQASGIAIHWLKLKGPKPDLRAVIRSAVAGKAEAIVVLEVPIPLLHLKEITELAVKSGLPAIVPAFRQSDGLIQYGTSILNATARIPHFVDKILNGAKPADLPVEVLAHRELVINLKTAKEIGVTIPSEIIERADRVIE
jgi:putative ABC transport system substrate-binding protein